MINETILFLTYYFDAADRNRKVLSHVINAYCPAYLPFDTYIAKPLEKIFSNVIVYDFLRRRAEVGLEAMNEEIIAIVRTKKPRYVLWTSFSYDIEMSTLEKVKSMGAVTVGWFFDDDWRFNNYSKYWAHYLDYSVTNSLGAVQKYKKLGANVIQTVPNTGITIDPGWSTLKEKYEVTFIGSTKFANRGQYINDLRRNHIPTEVFGEGSNKGYVSFDNMLEIFRTSKINLNFSIGGGYYWDRQIKGRIFQVCMAGGFLLTENTPGIERYYEVDKEIVCFENSKELVDKITYYLNHDGERKAIARAGWEKASREYTSSVMVAKVFSEIDREISTKPRDSVSRAIKLEMPFWIRRFPSEDQLEWAGAFLLDNSSPKLWQEALSLSLRYNHFNFWALYFSVVGIFPSSIRPRMLKIYRTQQKSLSVILRRLQSSSVLRKIVEPVLRKMW